MNSVPRYLLSPDLLYWLSLYVFHNAKLFFCYDDGCGIYRMAGPLKLTTGLTGMAVLQYPHRMLSAMYQKILKTIKEMPEDYVYRKNTQVTKCSVHNSLNFILPTVCLFSSDSK